MANPPRTSKSPPPSSTQSKLSFSAVEAANKAFAAGDFLGARQLCTKALVEYTPYHPVLYANRACIYSKLGYHDLAAGDAYRAVMLMEYVRAVLEGLEEESDEENTSEENMETEDTSGGRDGAQVGTPPAEGGTDAEDEALSKVEQGEESDEEGEPASIFTHIAQAGYATVSQFLKLSKGMSADDESEVRRADLSAFVKKFDMLASFYLINSLRQTSSLLDAYEFCESTLKRYGPDTEAGQILEAAPATSSGPGGDLQITSETFVSLKTTIMAEMNMKLEKALEVQRATGDISPEKSRTILSSGVASRQCYPWNTYEPDRFSHESLAVLNVSMKECAERALGVGNVKCEAKVVDLPDLNTSTGEIKMSKHLGIFCTKDIYEGETFFSESTTISGHPHPGRRILCDYCSSKLPTDPSSHHLCPKCPAASSSNASSEPPLYPAYCSKECLSLALASHHPTLCHHEDDLSWIYSDIISSPNPISIYSTLLIKLFATSLSRNIHPLELAETKYLYGVPPPDRGLTMRWDFVSCVVRPIWIMTQCLGVDIYAYPAKFDTWIINTLLAKIMGTCSGRFEPALALGAQGNECDDRPEVVNVHPTWALVNHDCEPNVGWKPEGKGKFWGLQPRGVDEPRVGIVAVRKGEEVKSCYTDRKLSVKTRREWARDMLGGDCLCSRCVREEKEEAGGKTDGDTLAGGVEKIKV